MSNPLVSIVMPSFNQGGFIERAIESIFSQDYGFVELIISDGGSTDQTVELLEKLTAEHSRLHWTSGPDAGPANAINIALSRARGTVIGWLNSDDAYAPGAISRTIEAFHSNPEWIMCYGNGGFIDENDVLIGTYPSQKPNVGLQGFKDGCFICQPTVFFKSSLLSLIGNLNEDFEASFDYDYWMRVFEKLSDRVGFIDEVQAYTRLHESTITQNQRLTVALEGVKLGWNFFGEGQLHWVRTYMDEIRPQYISEGGFVAFEEHINDVLAGIEGMVPPSELQQLRKTMKDLEQSFL